MSAPEATPLTRTGLAACLLSLKFAIEFAYTEAVYPTYGYLGLTLDPNWELRFWSIIMTIFTAMTMPRDKNRPSTYLFFLLVLFINVPLYSIMWLSSQPPVYAAAVCAAAFTCTLILRIKPTTDDRPTSLTPRSEVYLNGLFVAFILASIYVIRVRGGLDPRALDFSTIYDLRSENETSGLTSYLVNWCARGFFPFFAAYWIWRRRWVRAGATFATQIALYLAYGNKAFMMAAALLIATMIAVHYGRFFLMMGLGMPLAALFGTMINGQNTLITSIYTYRTLFLPAQIQYQYYDFFTGREKLMFAETFIGRIMGQDTAYPGGITYYITRYYGSAEATANSNTGIFSDAFANAGFPMVLLVGAFVGGFFLVADAIMRRFSPRVTAGALSFMMFIFNDVSFSTSMVTGGGFLVLAMLFLLQSAHTSPAPSPKARHTRRTRRPALVHRAT